MAKNGRKTIGNDLMDQLDGNPIELLTAPKQKSQKSPQKLNGDSKRTNTSKFITKDEKPELQEKERMTVQISKNTIEKVKDCVYWNRLTVAQFVEEALKASLLFAEKQNGKPFAKRRSELKPGRPTK